MRAPCAPTRATATPPGRVARRPSDDLRVGARINSVAQRVAQRTVGELLREHDPGEKDGLRSHRPISSGSRHACLSAAHRWRYSSARSSRRQGTFAVRRLLRVSADSRCRRVGRPGPAHRFSATGGTGCNRRELGLLRLRLCEACRAGVKGTASHRAGLLPREPAWWAPAVSPRAPFRSRKALPGVRAVAMGIAPHRRRRPGCVALSGCRCSGVS